MSRTWAFLACCAFLAGCTAPLTTPATTPSLVTYEDDSRSDGTCPLLGDYALPDGWECGPA